MEHNLKGRSQEGGGGLYTWYVWLKSLQDT